MVTVQQVDVPVPVEVNLHLHCPITGHRYRVAKAADDGGWILIDEHGWHHWLRKGEVDGHLRSGFLVVRQVPSKSTPRQ